MGKNTSIEWCHDTWSPWYGCVKVSAGCKNCYADAGSARNPAMLGVWGPVGIGKRRAAAESSWDKALGWDRKAAAAGERRRIFPSYCDPFEDWSGPMVDYEGQELYECVSCFPAAEPFQHETNWIAFPAGGSYQCECGERMGGVTMDDVRRRFARLIRRTPNLDWLLLTKRPQNAARMLAEMFGPDRREWPTNFRVGASIENQDSADERLPHLLALDWPNFVSYEPALGPVDFGPWESEAGRIGSYLPIYDHRPEWFPGIFGDGSGRPIPLNRGVDWVILGGESGPNARPMHPDWARSVRDQCEAAGVPFLFKQWGEWAPVGPGVILSPVKPIRAVFPDGRDLPDLTGRGTNGDNAVRMTRVGKKAAGRLLDGEIRDGFPDFEGVARG